MNQDHRNLLKMLAFCFFASICVLAMWSLEG
jgi:hypothetical protein